MNSRRGVARVLVVAAWITGLTACGSDDAEGGASTGPAKGPQAVFEPNAEGTIEWFSIPFPNDVYLGSEGTLSELSPVSDSALWVHANEALKQRRGFCTTCAMHFPVSGKIERASLHVSNPPSPDDAALLVDVDPESPERGSQYPLRIEWDDELDLITVRPVRGVVLRRQTQYAAVLRNRIVDTAGNPLQPSATFRAARDGRSSEAASRFHGFLPAAMDAVAELGVSRDDIATAAVFTTDNPLAHIEQLAAVADAAPLPTAAVDRLWSAADGSLDELLGIPKPSAPGMDAPSVDGSVGDRALAHEHVDFFISGTITSPRVVEGEDDGPHILRRNGSGEVTASGSEEKITFLLSVPKTGDRSKLPVAVVHWGIGGQRVNGMVLADTLGQHGIAVLGIDGYQHGDRSSVAKDKEHQFRGDGSNLGPDGIVESPGLSVTTRVVGVGAADPDTDLSPRYPLASLSQTTVDSMSVLRWLQGGDTTALQAADATLASLGFDPAHVFFVGESLGTIPTTALLTQGRGLAAAALAVPPGSLVDLFCEAPVYRGLATVLMGNALGVNASDYDERDRHLCAHPRLQIYRWVMEPLESVALAPYIFEREAAAAPPDVVFIHGDHDESVGTATPDGFVAAFGVPGSGTFEFAPVKEASLPLTANLETPSGKVTAAAVRLTQAGHGLLGQVGQKSSYLPPIVPPFEVRSPALDFENPTEKSHGLVGSLFSTRLSAAHGTIALP